MLRVEINWEKLALCGVNVEESKLLSTASRLNCKANYLHFTYLRLPLGGYPKRVSFWQPMIDKTHTKLDKWRKFNLSRGGRSTLCKSVLSNLPTYYMSLFLMPEKVISILERIMRNFFWEGHKGSKINHLVKWNLVIKPRIDEGLGFGGLKAKNLALLAKWGWRYLNEENSLWSQVVRSIHGKNTYNWHTARKTCYSLRSPWISISRTWLKVDALAYYKLGNGSRIAFWLDPWDGVVPWSIGYPKLFRVALFLRV